MPLLIPTEYLHICCSFLTSQWHYRLPECRFCCYLKLVFCLSLHFQEIYIEFFKPLYSKSCSGCFWELWLYVYWQKRTVQNYWALQKSAQLTQAEQPQTLFNKIRKLLFVKGYTFIHPSFAANGNAQSKDFCNNLISNDLFNIFLVVYYYYWVVVYYSYRQVQY